MAPILKKNKSLTKSEKKPTVISQQIQKKIKTEKKKKYKKYRPTRGLVFIKNIPHGFYEEQMEKFFSQFGKVTRLRLARSIKTGNSKGFAYIEFAVPEVAQIAAETMNNYLMFQKIVKTTYIPPEQQVHDYFKTQVKKIVNDDGTVKFTTLKMKQVAEHKEKQNNWNEDKQYTRTLNSLKKLRKLKKKFPNVDINFEQLTGGLKSIDKSQFFKSNDQRQHVENKDDKYVEILSTEQGSPKSHSDDESDTNLNEKDVWEGKPKSKRNFISIKNESSSSSDSDYNLENEEQSTEFSSDAESDEDDENLTKSVNVDSSDKQKVTKNLVQLKEKNIENKKFTEAKVNKSKNKKTSKSLKIDKMKQGLIEATKIQLIKNTRNAVKPKKQKK